MPRSCCVPRCKSNLSNIPSKPGVKSISTFSFPKDENLKSKWLKSIPRKDWSPTKYSAVCCLHFRENDIIREHNFPLVDGTFKKIPTKIRLKPDAVPSIFPNLPQYLSKNLPIPRKNPEERIKACQERSNKLNEIFERSDFIENYNDLILNYKKKTNICDSWAWMIKIVSNCKIHLTNECVSIENQISVDSDMRVKVYLNRNELTLQNLKWILPFDMKLSRWSQLENLLSRVVELAVAVEESTEVFNGPGFSADLQIVENMINPSNDAFKNSDHAIDSMLKVEPKNEYCEIVNSPLYNPRNTDTNIRTTELLKVNANVIPVACSSEVKEEFPNQKELVKCENNEAINEFQLSYDVTLDDLKSKNEEHDIKDAFKKETGYEEIFANKPTVKIENCEAWNKSEQVQDVSFEDWKIKNEEVDIKEEDLKNEISMVPYCGQEKQNVNQRMQNQNLRRHDTPHKKPVESNMFRCDQCDYQSTNKRNLKRHLLRHKDTEDVKMFKCDQCDYQSNKRNLKKHLLKHKDPKDVNIFKCDQCDYRSINKINLKKHRFKHKEPKDVNIFKCDHCDYQSINKRNLKRHLFKHKDPKDVNMFKCDHCDYQSIYKSHLKRHISRHKKAKEVNIFKCDHCDYQSINKRNLKRHLFKHKDPKDVNIFKCDQCDYQSIYKSHLKRHISRHKKANEVNIFKCDQCDFKSVYKSCLKGHLSRHEEPKNVNMLKCDQCDFHSMYKKNLRMHVLTHKNPNVVMFKCDQCDYQSNHKSYLKKHLLMHKKPKDVNVLKCDQCDFHSIYKRDLGTHVLLTHKNRNDVNMINVISLTLNQFTKVI